MNTGLMFSSETDEWSTPLWLFRRLNMEFQFELDAASTHANALCERHYTREEDGLSRDWHPYRTWLNPPYGRVIGDWVLKAREESERGGLVVCLLPCRTDTQWFHDYVLGYAQMRFIRGRLVFGGGKNSAPFPSVVAIFYARSVRAMGLPELGDVIDMDLRGERVSSSVLRLPELRVLGEEAIAGGRGFSRKGR